jgi:hypothetical protein
MLFPISGFSWANKAETLNASAPIVKNIFLISVLKTLGKSTRILFYKQIKSMEIGKI